MNAPIKEPTTEQKQKYFMVTCTDGNVLYEWGHDADSVANMINTMYANLEVAAVEEIK